jgi:hypothetical protein
MSKTTCTPVIFQVPPGRETRAKHEAPTPTAQHSQGTWRDLNSEHTSLPRSIAADGDPHRRHPPHPVLAPRGRRCPRSGRCARPSLPHRHRRRRGLRFWRRLGGSPVRALRRRGRAAPRREVRAMRLLRVSQARGGGRRRRHRLPRRRGLPLAARLARARRIGELSYLHYLTLRFSTFGSRCLGFVSSSF